MGEDEAIGQQGLFIVIGVDVVACILLMQIFLQTVKLQHNRQRKPEKPVAESHFFTFAGPVCAAIFSSVDEQKCES